MICHYFAHSTTALLCCHNLGEKAAITLPCLAILIISLSLRNQHPMDKRIHSPQFERWSLTSE